MALGTSSFSLLETVGSFGAICGRGMPVIPFGINEIKLRDNRSIWKRNLPERNKVVSNQVLIKLKKLLRSVVKEGTGKRIAKVPIDIIGKTGTSQKNRDAWFLGCAKKHVIGVWVGRDDDKSMKNIYGSTLPLSIFNILVSNVPPPKSNTKTCFVPVIPRPYAKAAAVGSLIILTSTKPA